MLSMASLPPEFWGEAVMTAVHIINRSPSTPLNFKIPQEMWTGKKPNYDRLRVFGCEALSHIPKDLRKKLDPKSHKCIFIGYGVDGEMGYRLWHPESKRVLRNVTSSSGLSCGGGGLLGGDGEYWSTGGLTD
ncbi:hypothetical protein L7F22_023791 [Adiantum nelumboides]|nr:hypothetical protein [Adiantum nelumboides]